MSVPTTPSSGSSSPYLSRTSSFTSISENDYFSTKKAPEPIDVIRLRSSSTCDTVSKICFVGAGYVGGPTAAIIAFANPHLQVTVVDMDASRIGQWKSRHLPIHEPGLSDIVRISRDGANAAVISRADAEGEIVVPCRAPNLFFSTECERHISEADICFLSVNTPTKMAGIGAGAATNISIFESAMRSIALVAKPGAVIVEKSTVPCRTAQVVRDILDTHRPGVPFEILSNPEFLAEGTAVRDLLNPSRVLIGSDDTPSGLAAAAKLARVYSTWVPESSILRVHLWSSELAKLVANAMLAQRISSINSISAICEKTGADVAEISKAIGMDPRIGCKFLNAGLGFGGSCFKKDVLSLSYLAQSLDLPEVAAYWRSVVDVNEWQCERFVKRVIKSLNGSLSGKKLTILGYAFKKNTSDTRESQSTAVVGHLLGERPGEIAIFDPSCPPAHIEKELQSHYSSFDPKGVKIGVVGPVGPVKAYTDVYEACAGASAVLVLTEWDQFRYPPLPRTHSSAAAVERCMQDAFARLANIHIKSDRNHTSDLASDNEQMREEPSEGFFRAQPDCPSSCTLCPHDGCTKQNGSFVSEEPLQWTRVAESMKLPRWVFDGRGLVEPQSLSKLGFRVESIGKASLAASRSWDLAL